MSAKILYIDMDDVLAAFRVGFYLHLHKYPNILFPQGEVGFFENLEPITGAIDAVNQLRKNNIFDVYILTAPSIRNPHSYTEKRLWVEKYFDYDFTDKLIICSNKALLKGDFLIDDNVNGKGQENFDGTFIHFGSTVFPDWDSVLRYLGDIR